MPSANGVLWLDSGNNYHASATLYDIIQGYGGSDTLYGGAGDQIIYGNGRPGQERSGDTGDYLYGQTGNDALFGAEGDDFLDGGTGNNSIDGGIGVDTVSYDSADQNVTVNLAAGTATAGSYATDTLVSIENVTGSHTNTNHITGDGGANLLSGGVLADTLVGGAGNDTLTGGGGNDSLLGGSMNDLIGGEGGNDLVNGEAGDDHLFGSWGSDTLLGGTGNDSLNGGSWGDLLGGEGGNDSVFGAGGHDRLYGSWGNDTLLGGYGNDSLYGGTWGDILAGDAGDNTLDGGSGDDTLRGGGGILAESMAARGATVTGIDMGEAPLEVARLHLLESGQHVDYRQVPVEQLADEMPAQFDVVTCMEMLEHVPDPASVVAACATLVKPGGQVFFSTINRNPKSYLFAIVGAEYVLRLLPRGTHDYAKFIRPSELSRWIRGAGLDMRDITGLTYNPLSGVYRLDPRDVDVNYMIATACPEPA